MIKMSEVLRTMKERGVRHGRSVYYDRHSKCFCALGALIKYHHPHIDPESADFDEVLLHHIYPELKQELLREAITLINDDESTISFDPVIEFLENHQL